MQLPSVRSVARMLAATSLFLAATQAHAQNFFFDRSGFNSFLGTVQVNDLNALANGATILSFGSLGTGTLTGASVTNGQIVNPGTPFTFSIAFSQLIDGFGADFLSGPFGGNVTYRFFNGATAVATNGFYSAIGTFRGEIPPGGSFNRVEVSEVPIPQSSPSLFSSLDNLTVGVKSTAVVTPEPSSIVLLAAGMIGVGIAARRRRLAAH